MPVPTPIDPLTSPRLALSGRVVTMDAAFTVISQGTIYMENGKITAVQPKDQTAPAGFEGVKVVKSGGTIYPGLIELHNHLSYNALRLWQVPKKYTNRDQWAGTAEYRKLVTGPMTVIGKHGQSKPDKLPALVRYVECKCLVGGVTTSQGIGLFSNSGVRRFYRGIVRNVEQTHDAALPEAAARIPDVAARDFDSFRKTMAKKKCYLLHLSEGTDDAARAHFEALKPEDSVSALGPSLAGIHCAALNADQFAAMAMHGASMVWSPLSNLLLYGQTADVKDAKAKNVRIGIGSDWSPTGSKNVLGELKVARLESERQGGVFSDREIVAMATRVGAAILDWDAEIGTLEPGKRADLLVTKGESGDPYAHLIEAKETAIQLVMINGVPRYGTTSIMKSLGVAGESVSIAGHARTLFLTQDTADEAVGSISLAEATASLKQALADLPKLALEVEHPSAALHAALTRSSGPPIWRLAFDEFEDNGVELRPRLPFGSQAAATGPDIRLTSAPSLPISQIVQPLTLDPLTVADDGDWLASIGKQGNLPPEIKQGMAKLF